MKTNLTFLFVKLLTFLTAATVAAQDVTQFGAKPDDGQDDTAAFLAAFKEAKAKGGKRIVIPKGRYELRSDGNAERPDILFPVADMDGLTIEGHGAELMLSGTASVFTFTHCRNVAVSGLTVDWARPPFSEGTVIATAPGQCDVKVRDEYPVKGGEPVLAFMNYHADTRLPDGRDNLDAYDCVERTELIAPQVLRLHLKHQMQVPVGTLLVLRHKVYGYDAFRFLRCANVTVSNVTVFTTPGMGLVGGITTNITLRKFNVRIRPGSSRLMSATADATHFGGCKGTVSMEDCLFEGMGDDGINIKSGLYLIIRQRVDDFTVLAQHNLKLTDLPDTGDTMEMAHTDTLSPFTSGTVREARMETGEGNMHRVRFESPLPAELREGDVIGNASRVARLRMSHCTVRANRARGILCQTRDAIIENCAFENNTGPGVIVHTEATYFYESIGTRDVIVRNNRFENCNRGAVAGEAALCAMVWLKDFSYPAKPGAHRNVTLEGNRIVRTDESGIFAVGVDGLTLRNNTIELSGLRGSRPHGKEPIWIQDCARVVQESGEKKALPKVRVASDGRTFTVGEEKPFVPMGVNYYRPGTGWAPQVWKQFDREATRRDFASMRELGVNCVRVFLTYGSFYRKLGELDASALAKFDEFLAIAEEAGIYVHPTGPDHWEGAPDWGPAGIEDERTLAALEEFWRLFAARYRGRSVIFAYDLRNEPEVGWNDKMQPAWNVWLAKRYGDAQAIMRAWGRTNVLEAGRIPVPTAVDALKDRALLDFQNFREHLADEWTRRQAAAIKSADPGALVTVGMIQWAVPALLPSGVRHYAAFRPSRQAKFLDFLEVHFYPLANGAYEYQGAEEESKNLAYLESIVREVAATGKPVVLAEFGWYGGGKPKFDGGKHPEATENQQAEYCRKAVKTSAGFVCGWLNWGFFDQPEATDCSEFTGLVTADGRTKEWGKTFQTLAKELDGQRIPRKMIGARPVLDWDACVTSTAARQEFQRTYWEEFRKDPF